MMLNNLQSSPKFPRKPCAFGECLVCLLLWPRCLLFFSLLQKEFQAEYLDRIPADTQNNHPTKRSALAQAWTVPAISLFWACVFELSDTVWWWQFFPWIARNLVFVKIRSNKKYEIKQTKARGPCRSQYEFFTKLSFKRRGRNSRVAPA